MIGWVFEPSPRPSMPVEGSSDRFPVRRIWCVGRNYPDHAREMGHDPAREPPFFFGKPADAIAPLGGRLPFPPATQNLHHEIELAVAIGGSGSDVSPEEAPALICGVALALDMTRRDLQDEAKRLSRPWDMGKGFDQSCPISALRRLGPDTSLDRGAIQLCVNGEVRQTGDLSEMIWSVAECLSALSGLVRLEPGDLVLTGTPAGVGPVRPGDVLRGRCALTPDLSVTYDLVCA
jgi:fumarylpyruvate hydrolase